MDSDRPQHALRSAREHLDDNAHEREVMLQRRSEAVADARAAGLEVRDIAVLINEDESTVYKILRAAGVRNT